MVPSAPLSLEMQLLKEATPPPHTLRSQMNTLTTPQAALPQKSSERGQVLVFEIVTIHVFIRGQLTPPPWSACQAV